MTNETQNTGLRSLTGFDRNLAFVCGVSLTVLTFYSAFQGLFLPIIQRSIHICLILAVTFLWYPASKKSPIDRPSIIDYCFTFLSLGILLWTLYSHSRFMMRIPFYSDIQRPDIFVGLALILLVLEAGRRTLGLTITFLAGIFILYAFAGPYMPAMFAHSGVSLKRFIDIMYMTDMGLFSSLMGLSATMLFVFISFGVFLQGTGTDQHYMDVSLAIAGKRPGGPAKVAILSSAAMGTISGSTIANIVTTGTLTIPLMKKTGYDPHEAGAIETAASAAGQIMPPIMGTGAFIMAEVLGVKYLEIVKVSLLPALLFYFTLWFFVDIKARVKGLQGLSKEETPVFKEVLRKSWHMFLPIMILVLMLCYGYTPFFSGAICTVFIFLMSLLKKETRISVKKLVLTIEQCAICMSKIAGIIACAAIIVAVINYTGLMVKSTSIILHISKGTLIGTILLEGIIAYILGMGLPIATSYIILAALGAPALIELGIQPIAAHLMIFWFAQLSTISPPVCMTAFAAAAIADAEPMKTGFTALKFGAPFYFVPLMFLFSNILNIHGNLALVFANFVVALVAFYFFASSMEGYMFKRKIGFFQRILGIVASCLMYLSTFSFFPGNNALIDLTLSMISLVFIYVSSRRREDTLPE